MFLFIFYVTNEYIKQYADVVEFMTIPFCLFIVYLADVAELADAPDLGSGVYDVQVQVLSSALKRKLRNPRVCKNTRIPEFLFR